MKYLKLFEESKDRFEIGDYVYITRKIPMTSGFFKDGEKYKITSINHRFNDNIWIINKDGAQTSFSRDSLTPEVEYNAKKYNL